jgi:sulfhydrogenase subunit alpha
MSNAINLDLNLRHVTRVEGHGNIRVNVRAGALEHATLDIVESPRFFEAMLQGRPWDELAQITCRICGICSVGHTTASLRATEDALGIVPTEQTVLLRKIMLHAEFLQSHVLHVYFLVAPDYFGVNSVFPLVETHKDVVLRAMRMKKAANDSCALLAGRHVHPIAMVVNGFSRIPTRKDLEATKALFEQMRADAQDTVDLFAGLAAPDFVRETEYISLRKKGEFALYDGSIVSSTGKEVPARAYAEMSNEFLVDHSTAKHARAAGDAIMVGALARVNNNWGELSDGAKQAADRLGLGKVPVHRPYMIPHAQVVEIVHCAEDGLRLIAELLERGLEDEDRTVRPRAGRGFGAVEVPRGILYHDYQLDAAGLCVKANCVIPTGQNLENIDLDMQKRVPEIMDWPREKIVLDLEMLVRAYDPCISCSAHFLDVEFVGDGD